MPTKKKPQKSRSGSQMTYAEHRKRGERRLAVWLPEELIDALEKHAEATASDKTELTGLALMAYLVRVGAKP